jgi:signal peptidase II
MKHARHATLGVYMLAFVGLADQITKGLLLQHISDVHETISLTSFLNLVLVWNKGVTFGILGGLGRSYQGYMPFILIGTNALAVALLGRWLWRTQSTMVAAALGAIMGGAIGNAIDRLNHGAVVDFLDFYYQGHHWYAFNLADAAIVTGVALLLIDGMVRGR